MACLPFLGACNDDTTDAKAVLSIKDASENTEFEKNETKTWGVSSENVKEIRVMYPAGWNATCDAEELTVTAPGDDSEAPDMEGDVVVVYSGSDGADKYATLHVTLKYEDPDPDPGKELTFELTCSDVTSTSVKLKVSPSDKNAGYYYDVCTDKAYEAHNGNVGAIVEGIINDFTSRYPEIPMDEITSMILDHGDSEDEVSGLPSDTDMHFYAVYIDKNGKAYGTSAVIPFHTLSPGKPEDCTFTFEFKQLLSTSVSINTIPSDPAISYWTSIEEAGSWAGDAAVPAIVKDMIEQYAEAQGMTVETVVNGVTFKGTRLDQWDEGIEPGKSYYAYAYAMDSKGNAAGPLFKERFTVPEHDTSEAAVTLTYRYFNGDSLYDSDPAKYPDAKGKVLLQVKASPNAQAANWVVALGRGDMTDTAIYPDESTKSAMLQAGQTNKPLQQFWIGGWNTCTLMAFAFDEVGIDGELQRELIELKPEGAASLEELAPLAASSVSSADMPLEPAAAKASGKRDIKNLRRLN